MEKGGAPPLETRLRLEETIPDTTPSPASNMQVTGSGSLSEVWELHRPFTGHTLERKTEQKAISFEGERDAC